jgi:dTDP-4-dehydrorhamnose 3,5-epimerase
MIYRELSISGLMIAQAEPYVDERGFFKRTFCRDELQSIGFDLVISQCNSCYTSHLGTIRGIHYQMPPSAESKLVRCTQGMIFDVVVDLRPESETFLQTAAIQLEESDAFSLLIPERCGHAFQTLKDHTIVEYCSSVAHQRGKEGGIRWNDPSLAIDWPLPLTKISDKDINQPLLSSQLEQLNQNMVI